MGLCYSASQWEDRELPESRGQDSLIFSLPLLQTTYLNIEAKAGIHPDPKTYPSMFFPSYFTVKLKASL